MAKLDPEEFSFNAHPSLGGRPLEDVRTIEAVVPETTATELMGTIRLLEIQLKEQRKRLKKMTDILHGRILKHNEAPTGMPVMHGYISSLYGMRRDPFTGKNRMHQGIDFAAKKGTKVLSIGYGVVSFSGKKGAYGNVVEVTHGKGVVSRYAHLSKMLVRVGERVTKGKEIAEIGSTGRSTGAHLHLEVLKKGRREDPHDYISSSKMK
jgi:murein DD-endopeptidase MepM/ murein hydrolase activator NlpD